MSLKDIQEGFNKEYPYLWIDFFSYPSVGNTQARPEKISPDAIVRNVCQLDGSRSINIDGNTSVLELENSFCKILGVNVKLMRKSGNVWVGTPYTSNWTLDNQNSEGQQIIMDH